VAISLDETANDMSHIASEAHPGPSLKNLDGLCDFDFGFHGCPGVASEGCSPTHAGSTAKESTLESLFESLIMEMEVESLPETGSLAAESFEFSLDCFDVDSEESFLEGLL